jgi:hypothetical protein
VRSKSCAAVQIFTAGDCIGSDPVSRSKCIYSLTGVTCS